MRMESGIHGKEQLILLPLTPQLFQLRDEAQLPSGDHAVVLSGLIAIDPEGTIGAWVSNPDSDIVHNWEIVQPVGPVWTKLRQVSASVSMAGIASKNADETDHLRWLINKSSWFAILTPGGVRIALAIDLAIQGFLSGWLSLAYHLVATGDLTQMPSSDEVSAILG